MAWWSCITPVEEHYVLKHGENLVAATAILRMRHHLRVVAHRS
jgi:hypothetical protein